MIKLFLISIFLLGLIYNEGMLRKDGYLKFACIFLFLLMGLRNELCFTDTPRYVMQFLDATQMSLRDVWIYNSKDPVFWIVSSIIGKMASGNYTIWLSICSIPFCVGLYRLLKDYSENVFISISILLGLGFFVFLFTGVRQTVAFGFVILAFVSLLNKKTKQFIAFTILAALFHKTAIVFLIMLPLSFVKINKKTMLLYIGVLIALMSVSSLFLRNFIFLNVMDYDERFAQYEDDIATLSNMGLYKQIFFFIISLVILWKKERGRKEDLLINAASVGIIFQSMSASIAEMFRISMYFSIANTVLLSLAINRIYDAGNRKLVSIGIPMLVFAYLIAASSTGWNLDYHFFFEKITSIRVV